MRGIQRESLLVLDGAFFGHRSFHSRQMPPLAAFMDAVLGVISRERPAYLVCAWDAEGPTFRHDLFEGYKSNRPEKDPALVEHLRTCARALRALGVVVWEAEGFEGDDVVASAARRWTRGGGEVCIYTADKDILQLVDEKTRVVIRGQSYDVPAVEAQYGVGPELVSSFLALAGDSADGIPGIPGIGKQTASRLLASFGSLRALVEGASRTGDRRAQAVCGREEELALFHRLTILREDVPAAYEPEELACLVHPDNLQGAPFHAQQLPDAMHRTVRRFGAPLALYRERSVAYLERLAMTRDVGPWAERCRLARRCAARLVLASGD